jgi:hypothetical protein
MKAIQAVALLGAAFIAACSERQDATAPTTDAVRLASSATIADRPYTWSVKCSSPDGSNYGSNASWAWTTAGLTIVGTSVAVSCYPAISPLSGVGTRPAAADGFSACVNGNCQSWTFDAVGAFSAQLKGSYKAAFPLGCSPFDRGGPNQCTFKNISATLYIDS